MSTLPSPGRWALGAEARARAEALLLEAAQQGLRTGWLGPEAGFLSNLSVQENLRLLHEWHETKVADLAADLQVALAIMQLPPPDWLLLRPSQLTQTQLLHARFLRVLLLRPALLVLNPVVLAQTDAVLRERFFDVFSDAVLLLLDQPAPGWPAWPMPDTLSAPVEETPA